MKQGEAIVKHRKKVIIQIIIPIIIALCSLCLGYFFTISYVRGLLIESKKEQSKELVKSAYSLIEKYYSLVLQGQLTEKQAKETIRLSVKNLKYGNDSKEYFWIVDYNIHLVSHPYFTDSSLYLKSNAQYHKVIETLVLKARQHNEDFVEYNWQFKDDTSKIEQKISFVKNFEPWHWVIGTGFYVNEVNRDIQSLIKYISVLMLLLILFTALLFLLIARRALFNVKQIIAHENELILSEKRFKGMAYNINSGLVIQENEKIVFFNNRACEIFGITEDEFKKYDIYNFIVPEEKERLKLIIRESKLKNSPIKELNFWINSKDNQRKYLVNRFSYEKRDKSNYTYILCTDNTEKKLLDSKIKSLSETIEQSPNSIVITDLNGDITYANKKFVNITGYMVEEIIGKNPRILKSGKMAPSIYSDLWKTITAGDVWEGELLNKKKNEELYWEQTIIFPMKNEDNEIINYVAIKTDITKQKVLENELKQSVEQAKISDKIKTSFLNNISHEVRTPLNAISGFAQLLREEYRYSDTTYEYLLTIINNSNILLKLFQNIIDYSSIDSGDIHFKKEEINIYQLLYKIATKYNSNIISENKNNIEIFIDKQKEYDDSIITTDKKYFTQIVDNILSNAVKYTNEGHINVGFKVDHENIVFYIKDTGIGIPADEYNLIFDKFTHGNNMYVSLHKGTGLGLNIANRLLQLMGGKLWFESEEKKGSTFYFSLPSIDVKNYSIGDNRIEEYPYSTVLIDKKIIIVENNDEHFFYLQSMLSTDNLKISWAKTGDEALKLLDDDPNFDLILLNINMSFINGLNISRTIRNSFDHISTVAMINSDYRLTEEEAYTFDAVLIKPFPKNILFKTLSETLSKNKNSFLNIEV